jgi:hypothetical protein
MDRKSAQERVNRITAFMAELRELDREGVLHLSEEQRAAIEFHHSSLATALERDFDVDTTTGAEKLSLAMKIASGLSALALSLALYFLVEQFWGRLPLPAQIGILAAAPLAAVALAELAARRERTLYLTSVLCAIAIAAFVLNLSQLPNLLSVRSSPISLALFAAMSLLLADRYRLRLPLFFGLIFATSFVAMFPRWIAGYSWQNLYERPELLILAAVGVGLFGRRQKPDFAPMYRLVCGLALLVSFLGLATSGDISFLTLDHKLLEAIYTLAGLATAAFGIAWGIRRDWTETTVLASVGVVLLLFSKMYDWLWDVVPPYLFFLLIGVISLALIAAFRYARQRLKENPA